MSPFRFAPERAFLPGLLVALLLAGCGTSAGLATQDRVPARPPSAVTSPTVAAVESQILEAADDWLGVPYRFGGTTQNGVDCSAFVRAIYASAYNLQLTRSTRTQVREGIPVERHELRTGDLVFFRTGPDRRHVGIYLDGDRMLHASSSKDRVLVDDFNQDYFQRTYWTARRLIDFPEPETPTFAGRMQPVEYEPEPDVALEPPARPGPPRSGW